MVRAATATRKTAPWLSKRQKKIGKEVQVPEYKYEMRLPKQKCYLFANPMLKTKKKISITFKMCKKRERQQRPPGGASQRAAKRNRKCRR